MRPAPLSVDTPTYRGRRRGHGDVDTASLITPAVPFLSCFLATESELDSISHPLESRLHDRRLTRKASVGPSNLGLDDRRRPQLSPERPQYDMRSHTRSPMTPIYTGLSGPASSISDATSSPTHSSFVSSAAGRDSSIVSSTRNPRTPRRDLSRSPAGGSGPQLIMPSVTVPSRRPFTETGKALGKLKVLVAGQRGTGKTSLVQSIALCCEHIVHTDLVYPSTTNRITEIYASTKPQPWWQADLDSKFITRRRLSSTEEMLHRNICFVDCATFRSDESTESRYVEAQLTPLLSKSADGADLRSLLSSGAEPIVDVVLYMFCDDGPKSADISCIKRLQTMTNVIPLLARTDELSGEDVEASKQRIAEALNDAGLKCFSFNGPQSTLTSTDIFAVSNSTLPDLDNMDASILMNSEYFQPLIPTELDRLVERVFSLDGSTWLRHSAAAKGVEWQRQRHGGSLGSALTLRRDMAPALTMNSSVARRQYWGRIEVSDWAQSLRHSLAVERLDSLADDKTLALPHSTSGVMTKREARRLHHTEYDIHTIHQDPLGLLEWASDIKHTGRLTLELVSSLGVLGCVAAWIIRPEWARYPELRLLPRWCFISLQIIGTV